MEVFTEVTFTSVVLENLTRLRIRTEIVASDPRRAAPHTNVTWLTAHVILGGATEGLSLVDAAGPCGDWSTVVCCRTLAVGGARSSSTIGLLPHLERTTSDRWT